MGLRSGGGFFLTPGAELDDGLLDICYASKLSKLEAFNLLYKAIKGTHGGHPAVNLSQSKKIEVFVEKGIPGQVDGEVLCLAGRNFVFEILPKALRVCAVDSQK